MVKCPECGSECIPVNTGEWNKGRYMCINYEVDADGYHVCPFIEGVYNKGSWGRLLYEVQPVRG